MKKFFVMILTVVLLCLVSLPCLAQGGYLLDNAELLSEDESAKIDRELDSLADEYGCNVGIITVDSLVTPIQSYADYQYDSIYGRDTDGILLVLNMAPYSREWAISFNGKYASFEYYDLMSDTVSLLQSGNNAEGLLTFISSSRDMFSDEAAVAELNESNAVLVKIAVCFIIGFIIAAIIVFSMKRKLKSVHSRSGASEYVVKDSFVLTDKKDIYLYSNITRVPIPRNTSGSRSGGAGGARGGASGRF